MSLQKLKIGLIGFGCVGTAVFENIQRFYKDEIEVKRICVKHTGKKRNAPDHLFTYEASDIIADPEIDFVVEVIDDPEAAFQIITKCLKAGKDVITANKAAVAGNLQYFIKLQKITGQHLLYEAAVAAAIPVIRILETQYSKESIESVEGILNGSTNYLLSKMRLEGMSFEEALDEAQQKGFAESDPRLDINGLDAAFKLSILSLHAYGQIPSINEVERTEFKDFLSEKPDFCKNQKSIAVAKPGFSHFDYAVDFREIEAGSPFSQIEYEKNAVNIRSRIAGDNTLIGFGAGADATASAILADIFQRQSGFYYHYKKYNRCKKIIRKQ